MGPTTPIDLVIRGGKVITTGTLTTDAVRRDRVVARGGPDAGGWFVGGRMWVIDRREIARSSPT